LLIFLVTYRQKTFIMEKKEKSIEKMKENNRLLQNSNAKINKVKGGSSGSNISGLALGLTASD